MGDETKTVHLAPLIKELGRVRQDLERMREGLGSYGLDMRSFGGDLKWIKEQAAEEKRELKTIGERVASLEGRMVQNVAERVTTLTVKVEALEKQLSSLNLGGDDTKQNERLADLEKKAAVWEAGFAAKEKAEGKAIEWWKWVLGAVGALLVAWGPSIIQALRAQNPPTPPAKKQPKESPK